MLILILFIVFGSLIAYLAQHNLMNVTVSLGPYIFSDIPLFYVIVGSVLTGLTLAYIIYIINSISTAFKLHGKDKQLKETTNEVLDLTKRVHQLELENAKLKKVSDNEQVDENAL